MSLKIPENRREGWSRITNPGILKKGDLLRILGVNFEADLEILDSHDPATELLQRGESPSLVRIGMQTGEVLPAHHHVLVRFRGEREVLSIGMHAVKGAEEVIFSHVTVKRMDDPEYVRRIDMLNAVLHGDNLGMFFISDQADIHASPEAQEFLDRNGDLDK